MLKFNRKCDYDENDEMEYGVYQIALSGKVFFNLGVYEKSLGDYTPSVSLNKDSLESLIKDLQKCLKVMEEYDKRTNA